MDYQAAQNAQTNRTLRQDLPPAMPVMSQVQSAQSGLDSNLNALHEAINALSSRLSPVLAPLPSAPSEKNQQPIKSVPSTVSQRIAESADVVSTAVRRITDLIDRLEV